MRTPKVCSPLWTAPGGPTMDALAVLDDARTTTRGGPTVLNGSLWTLDAMLRAFRID